MTAFALIVKHKTRPGKRNEVRTVWERHMAPAVAANPGHTAYFYCLDESDPDAISAFQVYESVEASQQFLKADGYAAYLKDVGPLLSGPPQVTALTPVWVKAPGRQSAGAAALPDPSHDAIVHALATVLREIVDGADPEVGWLLNPGDAGLLGSLDRLSAADASVPGPDGAASIAAHVEHLRYGLALLNRWAQGEEPYADADWAAAWKRLHVNDAEWASLRSGLRTEAGRWHEGLSRLVERGDAERTAALAGVAHLAYHLGAIRQLHRAARGPSAEPPQA